MKSIISLLNQMGIDFIRGKVAEVQKISMESCS
jgi:hypothetical protein